ncbi:MAG: alpha/beta hydrolase fold domain-containing protein [Ferruginibacter sp.]
MKVKILFPISVFFLVLFSSCGKGDDDLGGGVVPAPVAARTTMDTSYGSDSKQKMDIYLPANRTTASTKVIVMIHGGAWIGGDKADYATNIDSLKKRLPDYAIFNINYRLAAVPATNVFPTQENDIKAAIDFIYNNRTTFLISDKFVLLGASAGGHLSLLQAYKYQTPKIKAVIDYCGPTDMVAMYNDYPAGSPNQLGIGLLMSGTPATNAALYASSSPLTFTTTANACPTIIFQGTADLIVNANTQSVALKNKLTTATIANEYYPYAGLGHVDSWTAPTFTDTYNKIQAFLATYVP